jgi:hypothetical protein
MGVKGMKGRGEEEKGRIGEWDTRIVKLIS